MVLRSEECEGDWPLLCAWEGCDSRPQSAVDRGELSLVVSSSESAAIVKWQVQCVL